MLAARASLAVLLLGVAAWFICLAPPRTLHSVEGSCVIVTGGSYGIGPAIAASFLAGGARRVALVARSKAKLQAQAEALQRRADGATVDVLSADFGRTDAGVAALAAYLAEAAAECTTTVLVNNAALAQAQPFLQQPFADVERMFRVNVLTPLAMTQAFLEQVGRRQTTGHVVFVSSLQGMMSHPYMAAYAATKAAVTNFVKSTRAELFHQRLQRSRGGGSETGTAFMTMNVVNVGPVLEAGAYDSMNLTVHDAYGSSTPAEVGTAVVRAVETDSGSSIQNSRPFLPFAILDLFLNGRTWEVAAGIPGAPQLGIMDMYADFGAKHPGPIASVK